MRRICIMLTVLTLLTASVFFLSLYATEKTREVSARLLDLWEQTPEDPRARPERDEAERAARKIRFILEKEEGALSVFIRYGAVNDAKTAAAQFCSAARGDDAAEYSRARTALFDALGTLARMGEVSAELLF